LNPAWASSLWDAVSKKTPSQKRAGGVAQDIDPEFKPQCNQKICINKIKVTPFLYTHLIPHIQLGHLGKRGSNLCRG
jgi:hypothetical protein